MIRLLPYSAEHFETVKRFFECSELKQYFRRYPPSFTGLTPATAPQWLNGHYLIERDGKLVGLANLGNVDLVSRKAEVGIALVPQDARAKVAVEAFRQLFDYAFSYLGLNRLYALPLAARRDIRLLLLRFKFKHEGTLRANCFFEGSFQDEDCYSLLREDYLTIPERLREPTTKDL